MNWPTNWIGKSIVGQMNWIINGLVGKWIGLYTQWLTNGLVEMDWSIH
jgi:hypothetical protein